MNQKSIIKIWKYKGKTCVILWTGSYYCAYVETKLTDIPYSDEFGHCSTSPESNISAHGGVTFSGKLDNVPKELKNVWFFGMDFAHYGDYVEIKGYKRHQEHEWTKKENGKNNYINKSIEKL